MQRCGALHRVQRRVARALRPSICAHTFVACDVVQSAHVDDLDLLSAANSVATHFHQNPAMARGTRWLELKRPRRLSRRTVRLAVVSQHSQEGLAATESPDDI